MSQSDLKSTSAEPETISTGSGGLDDILGGGVDADRVYLLEGRPGTGKTTLALQFLLEGVNAGAKMHRRTGVKMHHDGLAAGAQLSKSI
jgi:predicted ATP-dependent serine protease